jgi:hypothetical protein
MRYVATLLLALGGTLPLRAVDVSVTVLDERGRPLSDAVVEALYAPLNDPQYASLQLRAGRTDGKGGFSYEIGKDRQMVRLTVSKQGYCDADADHRHGLGGIPPKPIHVITLPENISGIPLHYKDVHLSEGKGTFTTKTWVGFDFQVGEPIAPWGKGKIADIRIRNDGARIGWAYDEAQIERYRRDDIHRLLSDFEFSTIYGRFQGVTELAFESSGAGVMHSPAFWPYAQIKMPPLAPAEGYADGLRIEYDTRVYPSVQLDFTGYYFRVRAKLGSDGKVTSAHFAKIQGRISSGYGWVSFRYYYNPVADDRRLVFDPERNLLKPGPGAGFDEVLRYRASER